MIAKEVAAVQDMTAQRRAPWAELCSTARKVRADTVACVHLSYTLKSIQQRVILGVQKNSLHVWRYDDRCRERWHSEMVKKMTKAILSWSNDRLSSHVNREALHINTHCIGHSFSASTPDISRR